MAEVAVITATKHERVELGERRRRRGVKAHASGGGSQPAVTASQPAVFTTQRHDARDAPALEELARAAGEWFACIARMRR